MEIARIEIPKHIREVKMSLSQRIKYFEWTGFTIRCNKFNIPKRFFKNSSKVYKTITIEDLKNDYCIAIIDKKNKVQEYIKTNERLLSIQLQPKWKYILHVKELEGYQPVVANPSKVGTPNIYLINGQHIYSGLLRDFALGKVIGAIKECYKPCIAFLPVITEYPIDIECELHDTIKSVYGNSKGRIGNHWDVDNYTYPYLKAFPDLLKTEGKIRDDDRLHIPGTIGVKFIPIENHEDRKLVFIISKTTRPEITENKIYQEYHKDPDSFDKEEPKEDTGYKQLNLNL